MVKRVIGVVAVFVASAFVLFTLSKGELTPWTALILLAAVTLTAAPCVWVIQRMGDYSRHWGSRKVRDGVRLVDRRQVEAKTKEDASPT